MSQFEFFIAKRIIGSRNTDGAPSGTRPIIRIAVISIVLSLTIMLLAVAIVKGFQNEIRSKVVGFGSHIQITGFQNSENFETAPISMDQEFYPSLDSVDGVRNIQIYATKSGIITTDEDIMGIMVKGIGPDFDWSFFQKNLVEGVPFNVVDGKRSNEVVVSRYIANKLRLSIEDKITMVFIQNNQERKRRFTIVGIYETGMEQFDKTVMLADIQHVQRLNGWDKQTISGFEVLLEEYDDLERMDEFIYEHINYDLNVVKITDQHGDIFGWLELQDLNVIVIIALMILVSSINMISALLILILERTNMIGLLKAMGATSWSVRKIFMINATYLIGLGLLGGNTLGISLCLLQKHYGIIKLSQESYYIDSVPISLEILPVVALNAGTLILCIVMLLIPSYVVTKISPVKTIKFN